jgi:hypothetical protein
MAILRSLIEVLVRIDPAVWIALDLRSRSAVSWIPVALLLALFVFAAGECLAADNLGAGAFLAAVALALFAVKLGATAQRPYGAGPASCGK